MTRTEMIRELARREGGQFFLHQLYRAFGAITAQERRAVWVCLRGLVLNHQVRLIGEPGTGLYELQERPPRPAPLRKALWRAIRNNKVFTVNDLTVQTDASYEYSKKYVISLRHQGFIRRVGSRKEVPRNVALYRLVRNQIEPPSNTRRTKDVRHGLSGTH